MNASIREQQHAYIPKTKEEREEREEDDRLCDKYCTTEIKRRKRSDSISTLNSDGMKEEVEWRERPTTDRPRERERRERRKRELCQQKDEKKKHPYSSRGGGGSGGGGGGGGY